MSEHSVRTVPAPDGFDPRAVPIRRAATVMLVRDAADGDGVEVFMLKRTGNAAFGAGFYVFPGGRLDDADATPEMAAICDGLDDTSASAMLGLPSGGLSYWIGAVRECFEEAGVLLAASGEGPLRFDDPETIARFEGYRSAIHDGKLSLVELCETENIRLSTGSICYLSHWITPLGEARRFDTRILLARAPQGQEPLHDDGETVASQWIRPQEAIAKVKSGEMLMMPPTVASLRFVAAHSTADEALAASAAIGMPTAIVPKLRVNADGQVTALLLPGDEGYEAMGEIEYV
jgi:8-oxo-dGTP pyrophosphatase MutT (NUDIX family)